LLTVFRNYSLTLPRAVGLNDSGAGRKRCENAEVLDAVKMDKVDVAFTIASAARAKDMDLTPPYLDIELGYLLP
jgi:hypothetical protein